MKLHEIAHSRAGDKGNTLTLSLIPYQESDFEWLCTSVTAEKVKNHFQPWIKGEVVRYALPNIASLLFVCEGALSGGVTTSLALDAHGKTWSHLFLEMEVSKSE